MAGRIFSLEQAAGLEPIETKEPVLGRTFSLEEASGLSPDETIPRRISWSPRQLEGLKSERAAGGTGETEPDWSVIGRLEISRQEELFGREFDADQRSIVLETMRRQAGDTEVPQLTETPSLDPIAGSKASQIGFGIERGALQSEQATALLLGDIDRFASTVRALQMIPEAPGERAIREAEGALGVLDAIVPNPDTSFGEAYENIYGLVTGTIFPSFRALVGVGIKVIPASIGTGAAVGAGIGSVIPGPGTAVGAAKGAGVGAAIGFGTTSGILTFTGEMLSLLQENGVDTTNASSIEEALAGPLGQEIKRRAAAKGIVVGGIDALSAGVAGKFLGKGSTGVANLFKASVAEMGIQTGLAGTGEATGQLAAGVAGGEALGEAIRNIDGKEVFLEAISELVTGGPEIAIGVSREAGIVAIKKFADVPDVQTAPVEVASKTPNRPSVVVPARPLARPGLGTVDPGAKASQGADISQVGIVPSDQLVAEYERSIGIIPTDTKAVTSDVGVTKGNQPVTLGKISEFITDPITKVRRFVKRNLTMLGETPASAFMIKLKASRWAASEFRQSSHIISDFNRSIRQVEKERGSRLSQEELATIDGAIKQDDGIGSLPEQIQVPAKKIRDHVTTLSKILINEGVVQGNLAAVVKANLDTYMKKTYKIFTTPNYAKKVDPELVNSTISWMMNEQKNLSVEQARLNVDELLTRGPKENQLAFLSRVTGSTGLEILKKRKEIPEVIRNLWGEVKDPRVNYAMSIQPMAQLITNHRALNDIRTAGLKGGFFATKPTAGEGGSNLVHKFEPGDVPTTSPTQPLEGLFASKETIQGIKDVFESPIQSDFWRWYMKVNGSVKLGFTALAWQTHVRNFLSGPSFVIAHGMLRPSAIKEATKTLAADLLGLPIKEQRAKITSLVASGVLDESAAHGELMDVLRDGSQAGDFNTLVGNMFTKPLKKAVKAATRLYLAEDNFWRLVIYENAKKDYAWAQPELSKEQVEAKSAQLVSDTYPTYSLVARGVKKVRKFPATGTFVSFVAEIPRNAKNLMKLAISEVRSENPRIRLLGARRMAGMTAAAFGLDALCSWTRGMVGMTRDDEQAARRGLPFWSKNSCIAWTANLGGGLFRYIDLSYSDPWNYLKAPVRALWGNGDWQTKAKEVIVELASPYAEEEILFDKIKDLWDNHDDETGEPVYSDQDTKTNKALAAMNHLGKAFEGPIAGPKRILYGMTGKIIRGRRFDTRDELLAYFLGQRRSQLDWPRKIFFSIGAFKDGINESSKLFNRVATRPGAVSDQELTDAWELLERSRRHLFQELHFDTHAGLLNGMNREQMSNVFLSAALGEDNAIQAIDGFVIPKEIDSKRFNSVADQVVAQKLMTEEEAIEVFSHRFNIINQLIQEEKTFVLESLE